MCAIFGVICKKGAFSRQGIELALSSMAHRGPDDWGLEKFELDDRWDIWLGHRRLSIVDLSQQGHQPMKGKTSWIVFNGEIYNHDELRRDLSDKWAFRSRTDTEVLLAGLEIQGTTFLEQTNGMMAFGQFDAKKRSLLLARDRLGKKPLYYHRSDDLLVFSSELKAITQLGIELKLHEESLFFYRWLGYIPGPLSVYENVHKLEAGTSLRIDIGPENLKEVEKSAFWDPLKGYGQTYPLSYSEAVDQTLEVIDSAVRYRTQADVPVGLFLSGGIDSTLVLTSLAKQHLTDVKAYTVRFQDRNYDESAIALATAKQCNYPIEVLEMDAEALARQLEKIAYHYDEPFSDSSQIPTLAISELARAHVSVVLTGDGGDEAFMGYPRYSYQGKFNRMLPWLNALPFIKSMIRFAADSKVGPSLVSSFLRKKGQADYAVNIQQKLQRLKSFMSIEDGNAIYETMMAIHQKGVVRRGDLGWEPSSSLFEIMKHWYPHYAWNNLEGRSFMEKMAAIDLILYLRDDVLVKVDRATMAYSLEARSPLLDHRIIELGTSLPLNFKVKDSVHKRVLRDCVGRRLKGDVASLPKRGFAIPIPVADLKGEMPIVAWNKSVESMWMNPAAELPMGRVKLM